MTSKTAAIIETLLRLRRLLGVGLLLIVAGAVTACGDESEPDAGFADSGTPGPSGDSGGTGSSPSAALLPNRAPWIRGAPTAQAMAGQQYSFRPAAGDPDGNPLSFRAINLPRWAVFSRTTGRLSGTPSDADAGRYANINIEVSDGMSATRIGAFTIDVVTTASGSISISWIPATERIDGSPLTNLDGHRIHWGTELGNYTNSIFVAAGITAYVIDGLLPSSYYVAATTVDRNGLESGLSNPVMVTVQ